MGIERQWTQSQSDEIVRMREEKLSLKEIAEIFGCGTKSIITHLNRRQVTVNMKFIAKPQKQLPREDDPLPPGHPVSWGVISGNAPWPGYDSILRR